DAALREHEATEVDRAALEPADRPAVQIAAGRAPLGLFEHAQCGPQDAGGRGVCDAGLRTISPAFLELLPVCLRGPFDVSTVPVCLCVPAGLMPRRSFDGVAEGGAERPTRQ